MTNSYIIPVQDISSLAISGSEDRFPIRRIYCVGRNYGEHAREMGHDPDKESPFFFQKPPDAVVPEGKPFPHPGLSNNVHFEMELVVALGEGSE